MDKRDVKDLKRREALRIYTRKPVKLMFDNGNGVLGGTLCNFSGNGAQIETSESETIPTKLDLHIDNAGLTNLACRVVWRRPNMIGVSFAD
jgi:hypothetical protein